MTRPASGPPVAVTAAAAAVTVALGTVALAVRVNPAQLGPPTQSRSTDPGQGRGPAASVMKWIERNDSEPEGCHFWMPYVSPKFSVSVAFP